MGVLKRVMQKKKSQCCKAQEDEVLSYLNAIFMILNTFLN